MGFQIGLLPIASVLPDRFCAAAITHRFPNEIFVALTDFPNRDRSSLHKLEQVGRGTLPPGSWLPVPCRGACLCLSPCMVQSNPCAAEFGLNLLLSLPPLVVRSLCVVARTPHAGMHAIDRSKRSG